MTDYKQCPTCGAICTVEGKPDFIGDEYPVTMHYQPIFDILTRKLAEISVHDDFEIAKLIGVAREVREIMEATHD